MSNLILVRHGQSKFNVEQIVLSASVAAEGLAKVDVEKTVNDELKKLSLWLNLNRLALNVGKTNFVIFRSANRSLSHNVTLIMNR